MRREKIKISDRALISCPNMLITNEIQKKVNKIIIPYFGNKLTSFLIIEQFSPFGVIIIFSSKF